MGFVHGDFVQLAPGVVVPAAAFAGGSAAFDYTVVAGDSLSAIGARHGVDSRAIVAANAIAPPYVLHPGQVLRVPGAPLRVGELDVFDPLHDTGASVLTASPANGYHRSWGGDHAADLDLAHLDSPGCEVREIQVGRVVAAGRARLSQLAARRRRPAARAAPRAARRRARALARHLRVAALRPPRPGRARGRRSRRARRHARLAESVRRRRVRVDVRDGLAPARGGAARDVGRARRQRPRRRPVHAPQRLV
ncbi:MAG: LysM peptidoglycan-binding domain-containing protein [Chloroflexi bacterium]|nr:LysM peptidoglycan-binding domain-containing protein [Chloroflexota bacterium]